MSENTKNNFVTGAAILVAAGFISRFLGLFYRIVLVRVIGTEGVGLYQMAYPIYTFLLVFSVSGIPVALAKLVSEKLALGKGRDAYRIFRIALIISWILGGAISLFLIIFARQIIEFSRLDVRGYYTIIAIAPAIFVVSIMAAYRGFFQGMQDMKPTAYSQVIEQIVRMITIVGLAYLFLPYGIEIAAAGATFSAVTGAIFGLIVMLVIYYKKKKEFINDWLVDSEPSKESVWHIVKRIAEYAIPVVVAASVVHLMSLVSLFIIPQRLQLIGFTAAEATSLYGELTGVALVLVHFPEIITISLQTSLIPAISSAFTLGLKDVIKERTRIGLRLAFLTSVPSAAGLFILARPLCDIIFDAPFVASQLRVLSAGVIFIAIQQITSGILQGVGRVRIPARNLLIGAGVNAILAYFLTPIPGVGINGSAAAIMLAFGTVAFLNLMSVKRAIQIKFGLAEMLLKPLISSGIMMGAVYLTYTTLASTFQQIPAGRALLLGAAVGVGGFVYFAAMIIVGGVREGDLRLLPGARRLIAPLQRLGLLKV